MISQPNIAHRLRLLGVQGASKVMAGELSRLAGRALDGEALARFRATTPGKLGSGSLVYPFDPELARIAVSYHRTSARVLWDLYETSASRLEPLYAELVQAVAADARGWAWNGAKISVHAFAPRSVEAGERQVVGTVKNALIDGAARRGVRLELAPEDPDLEIHARSHLDADGTPKLTVSIDLAGRPMHQRGYRMHAGEAPLREDLAALIVMLARYDAKREALIDPMAGSGTIVIEAACMARARPIWQSGRRPTAENLPPLRASFARKATPLFADTSPVLFASEVDEPTFGTLLRAVRTSGVEPDVVATHADFRSLDPHAVRAEIQARGLEGALVLSNPPWGERIGRREVSLFKLYRDLGAWCREIGHVRAGFIVANPEFKDHFGGRPRVEKPLSSGQLRAMFYLYEL
jgi:23S rRNA G2445 N2-methylase RlmL